MTDFFYLHWHEDELLGVGYAPDDPALDRILAKPKRVVNWRPIAFVLKDGAFADYQANNLGLRLWGMVLNTYLTLNTISRWHW